MLTCCLKKKKKRERKYRGVCHLHNASPLHTHDVLVDADDHLVLQNAAGFSADVAQVVGHEQGSGHDRPQRHLSTGLFRAEAKVTGNQLRGFGLNEKKKQKKKVNQDS